MAIHLDDVPAWFSDLENISTDEMGRISINPNISTRDAFVEVVQKMFDNRDISAGDLPITTEQPQTRYLINAQPTHLQGHEMIEPVEIANGIYLETNYSSETKKRYIKYLIDEYC